MNFNDTQPIYLQIGEWIGEQILNETWKEEERIPSVRELGAELEVNPNTCMRTYEWLQERDIIYTQRGIGYFVAHGGRKRVKALRRKEFFDLQLPQLFKTMRLLDIEPGEIMARYSEEKRE